MLSVSDVRRLNIESLKKNDPIFRTIKKELSIRSPFISENNGQHVFFGLGGIAIGYVAICKVLKIVQEMIFTYDMTIHYLLLDHEPYIFDALFGLKNVVKVRHGNIRTIRYKIDDKCYDTDWVYQHQTIVKMPNWCIARELLLVTTRSKVKLPKDVIQIIWTYIAIPKV